MRPPKIALAVVLVVVAAAVGAWFLRDTGDDGPAAGLAASGTVEATDATLGFQLPGTLAWVGPREGDRVAAGEAVARLATGELEAQLRQARARAEAAAARLGELESGFRREEVAQARSRLGASRQRLLDAERDHVRTRTLEAGGAVPREALDKATLARELAAAEVEQAREQLALLERGPRPEQVAAARAERDAALAAAEALEARLADTEIAAPAAGTVQVRHREPGEVVAAGSPVLTLSDLDHRWVRIYVPEPRVGAVHLGAAAAIRSDTHPGKRYAGEVVFIASEAEFTPENVQTPDERVRLVYAVKVRVADDREHELKPGMPVDVELALAPPAGAEATAAGRSGSDPRSASAPVPGASASVEAGAEAGAGARAGG